MKIVLNPTFAFLKDFIVTLPEAFTQSGEIIYKGRNEIRVYQVNDLQLNVKRYKKPILFNRIVYSFFRPTKAERAYQNALRVLEKGFETPTPVAYIEKTDGGLFSDGYFVSLQCPYPYTFRKFGGEEQLAGNEAVLAQFARYTARLHANHILHLDYSPGNILFDTIGGVVRFSLLDINRMQFCDVDEDMGCRSFERLSVSEEMFRFMAAEYAKARGFDAEKCIEKVLNYHRESEVYFSNKATIKKKLKEKDYLTCLRLGIDNLRWLYFS